jgi:phage-related protein
MRQLVNTGVSAELIYNALSRSLGKSREEVMKLQKARKITSEQAIDAFKEAIKLKAHESTLGQVGAQFADNKISGMLGQASGAIRNWFIDLGERVEPAASRISKKFFGLFNEMSESGSLRTFSDFVVDRFQRVEFWINDHWPQIRETVMGTFDGLLDTVQPFIDGLIKDPEATWKAFQTTVKGVTDNVWGLVQPFVALANAVASIIAFKNDLAGFMQISGGILAATGVGALPGAAIYAAGSKLKGEEEQKPNAAAAAGVAAAGVAGQASVGVGRNFTIGSISMPIEVHGAAGQDPKDIGEDIDARVRKNFTRLMEEFS